MNDIARYMGNPTSLRAAIREASRFVRKPVIWDAITSLAGLLQKRERIESNEEDVQYIIAPVIELRAADRDRISALQP